jgi:hypothetical protein
MSAWTDKRDAFWATVEGWITTLEGKLEGLFTAGAAAIAKSIEEQKPKIEGDVKDFIKKAADDSVKAAEGTDAKGQGKMEIALTTFWGILETVGLQLAENEARLILEGAVAALKLAI